MINFHLLHRSFRNNGIRERAQNKEIMKNVIGIAVVASMMFACNGVNQTNPENQRNAELKSELLQAQHETELMKLTYEMELLKARQEGLTPAQVAALGNTQAYLGGATPNAARPTQQVDNEWTSSDNDAYRPATTTPTTQTVPASEVKKKKGMSTPVKGALIGAGVGAATGAIVAKNNRVKGAVIGAVAGAGAGAVTGVVIDKKNEKKLSTPYYASNTFLK
jgi:hypothetical protein